MTKAPSAIFSSIPHTLTLVLSYKIFNLVIVIFKCFQRIVLTSCASEKNYKSKETINPEGHPSGGVIFGQAGAKMVGVRSA